MVKFSEPNESKYGCDTCEVKSCQFHLSKKPIDCLGSPISGITHVFTREHGCTMHSSIAQRDREFRDETLNDFIRYVEDKDQPGWGYTIDLVKEYQETLK